MVLDIEILSKTLHVSWLTMIYINFCILLQQRKCITYEKKQIWIFFICNCSWLCSSVRGVFWWHNCCSAEIPFCHVYLGILFQSGIQHVSATGLCHTDTVWQVRGALVAKGMSGGEFQAHTPYCASECHSCGQHSCFVFRMPHIQISLEVGSPDWGFS